MALLSVIVPVYNVASYLEEGLKSVLSQDYKNIEVICINDASSDDSYSILKRYESLDPRIRIINHLTNKGVSAARNTGIINAKGDYIAFFDPDDNLKPNIYSKLISIANTNNVDVIQCGFETFPQKDIIIPSLMANTKLSPYNYVLSTKKLHSSTDFCFSWRFLFKTSFLRGNKLLFNENIKYCEDMPFNFEAVMCAKSVFLVPEALYLYRTNNTGSIMKKKYNVNMETSLQLQIAEKKRICNEYNVDKYTPFTKDMSEDIVKRYTMMMFNNIKNNPNGENLYVGVKRVLNMPMVREAMNFIGLRNIYSSWKEYIFYLCMKFKLYNLVVRIIQ